MNCLLFDDDSMYSTKNTSRLHPVQTIISFCILVILRLQSSGVSGSCLQDEYLALGLSYPTSRKLTISMTPLNAKSKSQPDVKHTNIIQPPYKIMPYKYPIMNQSSDQSSTTGYSTISKSILSGLIAYCGISSGEKQPSSTTSTFSPRFTPAFLCRVHQMTCPSS